MSLLREYIRQGKEERTFHLRMRTTRTCFRESWAARHETMPLDQSRSVASVSKCQLQAQIGIVDLAVAGGPEIRCAQHERVYHCHCREASRVERVRRCVQMLHPTGERRVG